MEWRTDEMEICDRYGKLFGGRIALVFGKQLKITQRDEIGMALKQWFALGCASESSWGSPLPHCSGHTSD